MKLTLKNSLKGNHMITNQELISTLNHLIQTCKDGEVGFRTCAVDQLDPTIRTSLMDRSASCAAAARELQNLVIQHGGSPEQNGSFSGTLHRRWIDIKSAVMGKDERSILDECERGEDVAKHNYSGALAKDLPPLERAIIERQYQGVLRNHEAVKMMRDHAHTH
jgi:uncharacterized protein (TIGR02284 family)